MNREEKITAIYKEMANKEVSFGCKLQVIESEGPIQGVVFNVVPEGYKVLWDDRRISTETKNSNFAIIGHPVMIGDVIKWIKENREMFYGEYLIKLLGQLSKPGLWRDLNLSIDDQSDECIDYVYSLIQKD